MHMSRHSKLVNSNVIMKKRIMSCDDSIVMKVKCKVKWRIGGFEENGINFFFHNYFPKLFQAPSSQKFIIKLLESKTKIINAMQYKSRSVVYCSRHSCKIFPLFITNFILSILVGIILERDARLINNKRKNQAIIFFSYKFRIELPI